MKWINYHLASGVMTSGLRGSTSIFGRPRTPPISSATRCKHGTYNHIQSHTQYTKHWYATELKKTSTPTSYFLIFEKSALSSISCLLHLLPPIHPDPFENSLALTKKIQYITIYPSCLLPRTISYLFRSVNGLLWNKQFQASTYAATFKKKLRWMMATCSQCVVTEQTAEWWSDLQSSSLFVMPFSVTVVAIAETWPGKM